MGERRTVTTDSAEHTDINKTTIKQNRKDITTYNTKLIKERIEDNKKLENTEKEDGSKPYR